MNELEQALRSYQSQIKAFMHEKEAVRRVYLKAKEYLDLEEQDVLFVCCQCRQEEITSMIAHLVEQRDALLPPPTGYED
jgi:hypothetical protein